MLDHESSWPPKDLYTTGWVTGFFWHPDTRADTAPGILEYEPKRAISLALMDSVTRDERGRLHREALGRTPVLHGVTADGTPLTLLDGLGPTTSRIYRDIGTPGATSRVTQETYRFNKALIGAHITAPAANGFSSGRFTFADLTTWINESPFTEESGHDPPHLTATAQALPGITCRIPARDATMRIDSALDAAFAAGGPPRWLYTPYIDVTPDRPQPLDWYQQMASDLRMLIAFCTFSTTGITGCSLRHDSAMERVSVLWLTWADPPTAVVRADQCPVTLPVIRAHVDTFFNDWFVLVEQVRPALELLNAVLYGGLGISTFSFLALTQAIERFHDTLYPATLEPRLDFRQHRRSILKAIPTEIPDRVRTALCSAIGDANRYSLRDRLNALTTGLGPLQSILGGLTARDMIAIVAARNDLTHRATAPVARRHVSGYARRLEILLLAHIYKRLGVNDEAIRDGLAGLMLSLRFLAQP